MAARFASNNIDEFEEGGLYPGGTGVIEEIKYVLWDYDGKQPKDSVIAVYVKFQPTDGSNEGKPVPIHWAAGNDVKSFAPDPTGGHLVILGAREKQSQSSNWAFVLKKFRDNCGMDPKAIDGPDGILALARTQVTFARVDQPTRDIADAEQKPAEGKGGKDYKRTVLVPTKATFPWEKGGARANAAKPTANATPAPTATPTNGSTPASGELDLSTIILEVVTAAGGSIEFKALGKAILEKLPDVDRTARTALIKQAKDESVIKALADENAWTFDGKELIV